VKSIEFKRGRVAIRGHHNDSTYVEVKWDGDKYKLLIGAGSGDRIHVARDGDIVFVMSYSVGMDHISVMEFNMRKIMLVKEAEEAVYAGDDVVCLQSASEELMEHLRKPWHEYTDQNLLRSLLNLYG
jgi:hypothetical protein